MKRRASGCSVNDSGKSRRRGGGNARSTPRTVFSMMRTGTHSSASPRLFRAPRIDGLAGQQQVERGGRADEPRQALDAAPAGNDPQHHFGEAEPRSRLVDDDAIPARERQFQAAAQTETANERQRRILDVSEPLERVPAALDDRDRAGLVLHAAEFVDIGAGNEAVRLAGTYHETLRRIAIEEIERLVQFGQHCGGQAC